MAAAPGSPNLPSAPVPTFDLRKSSRLLSPQERLPKGLPDWFLKKDVDGDGQVSMTEFSSEWNSEVLRDFVHYDLDNDGLITAPECLKTLKDAHPSERRVSLGR